jgi:hypothetical protein
LHRDSVRTGQHRPVPADSTCCLQLVHGSARRAACGTAMVCAQTSAAAAHRTTSRRSRHIACTSVRACDSIHSVESLPQGMRCGKVTR